jgi:hypothetical protein
MTAQNHPTTLDVVVESQHQLDGLFDAAVERLRPAAVRAKAGIEVARTGIGTYRASVRDHITFGTTVELCNTPIS